MKTNPHRLLRSPLKKPFSRLFQQVEKPPEEKKLEEEKKEEAAKLDGKKAEESKDVPPPPPPEIVLRVFMHCEGCARKVWRCLIGFDVLVEKILRVQPDIKKLYLLMRASDQNSLLHRFRSDVTEKDLFSVLKQKHGTNFQTFISEKVVLVAGDMGLENLGVANIDLLNEMRRQVDVVVGSAAATKFDERYDVAFAINTHGAKHISIFVNECTKIKLFLHVSTAYVAGETSGIIPEKPFKMGETLNGENDLNIEEEKKMILERHRQLVIAKANEEAISSAMKDFGIQRFKGKVAWVAKYLCIHQGHGGNAIA